MDIIAQLGSLLGLSFISGINLYATVAVVGICTRLHLIQGLPPEFHVLGNEAVIFVAVLLYLVEFFVDKVPGFDTLWDTIHTLIRPAGGAMLALMQVGEASPALEVIAAMVGASMASVAHVTKAGTRLIINTSPEPFSNILVSLTEDAGAIGFAYLSLAHPRWAFFLTLLMVGLLSLILPLLLRTVRMLFGAILFKLRCAFSRETAWALSRSLPYRLDAFFDQHRSAGERLTWTGRAFALRVPRVRRFGSLQVVVTSKAVHILHRHRFKLQEIAIPAEELEGYKCYPGLFLSRFLLRTSRGDWLFYLYEPLSRTLPQDLSTRALDAHVHSS